MSNTIFFDQIKRVICVTMIILLTFPPAYGQVSVWRRLKVDRYRVIS